MKRDVLVVDRDRSVRYEIHRLLSRSCDVTSVSDGMSALYHLRRNPLPNLIIVDPLLDDFPEWTFLRHLRSSILYSSIPIVVLSDLPGRELRAEAIGHGVMEAFTKPVDGEVLERVVEGILAMEEGHRVR
jgi:PleD family two-component response regulator